MNHVTLRSPADLISAVPYFFGFHPADSLVLLAFHGKRIIFQARIDIPEPGDVDDVALHLADITSQHHPAGAVLVAYGTEVGVLPLVGAVGTALAQVGIPVRSVLRVHEGRFWEMLCDDPSCCSVDGVPFDGAASEFAAVATFAGMVAHPDRAALAATIAPLEGAGIEPEITVAHLRMGELPGGLRAVRSAARVAVRELFERYATRGRLDDDEVAWLAVLLTDVASRDDAWARMLAGPPAPEQVEAWRDVVRRVPERFVAAPATLLALVAWRSGNGALADMAVSRALEGDPTYQLARLLQHALCTGVSPDVLDEHRRAGRRRRAPRLTEAA